MQSIGGLNQLNVSIVCKWNKAGENEFEFKNAKLIKHNKEQEESLGPYPLMPDCGFIQVGCGYAGHINTDIEYPPYARYYVRPLQ